MTEEPLKKIPFGPEEEEMIASMARWMNFVSIVIVVGGLLMFLAVSVFIFFGGAAMSLGAKQLAKLGGIQVLIPLLGIGGLFMAGFTTYAGAALHRAAEDLDRVATTNEADQRFLETGLTNLLCYVKIQVLLTLAGAIVGVLAVIFIAAMALRS